jgi:hypothetical protein
MRFQKIVGAQNLDLRGGCRRVCKGTLKNVYCLPHINVVTKPRQIRYRRHVAGRGRLRNACTVLTGKLYQKIPTQSLKIYIFIFIYLYIAVTNTYIKTRFKGTGCRRTLSSAS